MEVYWELQQSSQLCAVHAVNTLLQAPVYTEVDLGEIGQELDTEERKANIGVRGSNQNVSLDGYFSIQVIIRALHLQGLTLDYLDRSKFQSGEYDPSQEHGLLFNRHYHWQTLRRIRGVWYDLNSLNDLPGPIVVSDFMLTSTIEAMINDGFTVFVAKGEFVQRRREEFQWTQPWQFWVPESTLLGHSQSVEFDADLRRAIEASRADAPEVEEQDPELAAAIALSLSSSVPTAPTAPVAPSIRAESTDPRAIQLKVKFPDGSSQIRRFLPEDLVQDVADWVHSEIGSPVALYSLHPRTQFDLRGSLASQGIAGPALIVAEKA